MTYVVADTQREGKEWAKAYLSPGEKCRVFSTPNQIRGHAIWREDCVYIITSDTMMAQVLTPALCGCRVTSCNEWITGKWKEKYDKYKQYQSQRPL